MSAASNLSKYHPPKQVRPEHKDFLLRIGKRLKELREEEKHSLNHLAELLHMSRTTYTQMEKGVVYINMLSLLEVLDFYKIPASQFFKEL